MRDGTIYALSTGRGAAAIAVLRVSGPAAVEALRRIAGRVPPPRRAALATLRDPATDEAIDRALVLYFQGPASETGEDMAEFQVHGGPAVIAGLLLALGQVPSCRPAEPGEFTRRAFENGKLDLSAAEGIADLVAAETAAQRRQALGQAAGGLAGVIEAWTTRLTRALAHLEAAIDFADEELPAGLVDEAGAAAAALADEIALHLADGGRGERLRHGLSVAITGPPNCGKSSLLNALAGRDAAIVSAVAGTTRDVIEVHLDLAGYPVVLADTAGLRDSNDPVEAEGVRRARARAASADLVLAVSDAREGPGPAPDERALPVANKIDLLSPTARTALDHSAGIVPVSARTGEGLDRLVAALTGRADQLLAGEPPLVTRARHREALAEAVVCLARAQTAGEPALVAEDLRLALRSLGRITGRVDVEAVLDVIFREFCIGK
jgi:tRNA modification GTPase